MLVELQKGLVIQPGTFNAVIAHESVVISMINANADLQRYLFLFIGGNYSRILSGVHRTATNFDVQRAFTAHQLFTCLTTASHTFVFVEHDATLYDGAWDMITPIASALLEISRESTVILYSPTPDRAFRALIRDANRVYFLSVPEEMKRCYSGIRVSPHSPPAYTNRSQKTLDGWAGDSGGC
jgi:DNA polymerase I